MNENEAKVASRLKTFDECDDAEKIRRLRQEIEHLRTLYSRQSDELAMLKAHQHGTDGKVVVEIGHAQNCTRHAEGGYNYLR